MNFLLTTLRVLDAGRLDAEFQVQHPTSAIQGTVRVAVGYSMNDTLAQVVVRAREILERGIEELD